MKGSLVLVMEGIYFTFYGKSKTCFAGTDGRLSISF